MRQTALLLRQKAYLALKMYTRNNVTIYIHGTKAKEVPWKLHGFIRKSKIR